MRLAFWLVEYVLCIFWACYTYIKCLLESRVSVYIIYSITRHVERISWQEKAICIGFKKIILRTGQNVISTFKKSFFQTLTRLRFWLVEYVLCIFGARCAYVKYSLESRVSFDISYGIIQYVEMISRQEKAIFVDLRKIILRRSQNPISTFKKSFFQTLARLLFWLIEYVLCIFWERCAYV